MVRPTDQPINPPTDRRTCEVSSEAMCTIAKFSTRKKKDTISIGLVIARIRDKIAVFRGKPNIKCMCVFFDIIWKGVSK